jgi:superfamily II DNA or RNA helicase/HKD family nuclease/diadenosine tetraphosphate (Ap4A) HIT family hydrolase
MPFGSLRATGGHNLVLRRLHRRRAAGQAHDHTPQAVNRDACPFCPPEAARVFYRGERVVGFWDAFPVSPGHALLTPRRHVSDWSDATPEEQTELVLAIDNVRRAIERDHRPEGYNVGMNLGRAAGQTVFHLHIHVIPRYAGDTPDPSGGVRHVIPGRGRYAINVDDLRRLVRGSESDPLITQLVACLDGAAAVDIVVAFTMRTGVRLIEEHLRDVLNRGGRIRILTGDYLGVTEPEALLRLLDLQGDISLRIFQSDGTSFHPKAFVVAAKDGSGTAFVGSSNLSASALQRGIEWNYRVVTCRDGEGFAEVLDAFETLWTDQRVAVVDNAWVQEYQRTRTPPPPRAAGVLIDPTGPPPEPHPVQAEALLALETTRAAGSTAGLVVLATGLGKTWLSAFDSMRPGYDRILFVAHREEILTQAMRTYRAIRPKATLGFYTGEEKTDADILFASIQTLGRRQHLYRFDPKQFGYIVVDEFHHASAQTYRRVLGFFEPRFLLGLTATPERTDGADLLALCGNIVAYRCDVADGIRRGLLSPFAYYGVPDIVDYENIPWRGNRFDEEELTQHVATQARAQNALEQHRERAGQRTIGFCVSQRHADFMAEYFRGAGLRAVAVHAGSTSAPRAHSLEELEAGELDVVFAVDMFNEGVDLPQVDTVLMLRPTESRTLWLQQFGRGLRYRPGKTLNVIDYIGNHRVFLTKTRALFGLGNADRQVAFELDRYQAGRLELPPGCSVTYELEAIQILRALLRTSPPADRLRAYYEEFRERTGERPLALEVFQDGFNPRSARGGGHVSWLDFVDAMDDLTATQRLVRERLGAFLDQLETTPMTRSYKMLVLLAMIGADKFPGSMDIGKLVERFGDLARRYAAIRNEVGAALDDPEELRRLVETNPINAWVGGAGTGGVSYFRHENGAFATTFEIGEEEREAAQDLAREIGEWRLMEYMRRLPGSIGADRFVCSVSQSRGRPILFLPDRERHPGLPEGWTSAVANDDQYQVNFVKIAVNVATRPGSRDNVLPEILRDWFGTHAGQPGRADAVVFERTGNGYVMAPAAEGDAPRGPVLWQRYTREEAAATLGIILQGWERQSGIVEREGRLVFLVTLDKAEMADAYKYRDRFLSPVHFEWQSQNKTRQKSKLGRTIRDHREQGVDVHLFARQSKRIGGKTSPFLYCGRLEFEKWDGERPITVWWRLEEPVPERLWEELGVESVKE